MTAPDPTDIDAINDFVREASDPPPQRVRIDQVILQPDALLAFEHAIRETAGGGRVLLVQDHTLIRRRGENLKERLHDIAASCGPVHRVELQDEHGPHFHADRGTAVRLAKTVGDFEAVVSIGSGSITDVAKYARHLHAEDTGWTVPLICFPTAASVTAYTSALAVLTVAGVKRTLPARGPDRVICDLRTLADAPRDMTQAGFGDVLARSVSAGDWWLANQLGMDSGFNEVPIRLLADAEQRMLDCAARVPDADMEAVAVIMRALLLAGMAMSIARQTAPLSGWEHVLSHFLDLTAADDGRNEALHGAQVGVGTLVSARAYPRLAQVDPRDLLREMDPAVVERDIHDVLAEYCASDALQAEVRSDLQRKVVRWNQAGAARARFVDRLRDGSIAAGLRRYVRPLPEVEAALRASGAPLTFAALRPAIPEKTQCNAILHAHQIRARFTLGDLLDVAGQLAAIQP